MSSLSKANCQVCPLALSCQDAAEYLSPLSIQLRACHATHMAVGQNQWYHFGVGASPILVYFSGDWDVHWGYDLDFDPWPYAQLSLPEGPLI